MTLRVRSPSDIAGVECPKKTGQMDEDKSCKECSSWSRCMMAVGHVLGAEG